MVAGELKTFIGYTPELGISFASEDHIKRHCVFSAGLSDNPCWGCIV